LPIKSFKSLDEIRGDTTLVMGELSRKMRNRSLLKDDALANALMKAETRPPRRQTRILAPFRSGNRLSHLI